MMKLLNIGFLLILVCWFGFAQEGEPFELHFPSKVKEEKVGAEIIRTLQTQQYYFYDHYPVAGRKPGSLFIHQRTDLVSSNFTDANAGILTLKSFVDDKKQYDKNVWTIVDSAHQSEIWKSFIKTTTFACCASENTYRYYDIVSGAHVFSCSTPVLSIEVFDPASVYPQKVIKRYISYLSSEVLKDNPFDKLDTTIVGKLIIAGEDSVFHTIVLRDTVKPEIQPAWSPKMTIFRTDDEKEEGKEEIWFEGDVSEQGSGAISGFFIRLFYDYADSERELIIPVVQNRFDIELTQKPNKFHIEKDGK